MSKPFIAVDFDDTICHSSYPECGPLVKNVRESLERLKELGYFILIYSCRTSYRFTEVFGGGPAMERTHVIKMKQYLDENEIPYDEIDDGGLGKPHAVAYIDDKGIRFENNWPEIVAFIEEKRPQ